MEKVRKAKENEEGKFNIVLQSSLKVPGVRICREDFLKRELSKYYTKDIVMLAIEKNPAIAGISLDEIEKIAKSCINFETNKVTGISTVAGIPGGFAMIGTIPADIAQYFAHVIRILQKLIYLYGWEDLYNSDGEFDDETTNKITIFMGVMFGVNAANKAIIQMAKIVAINMEKKIASKALTKGMIYPVVKKIAQILGAKMTKQIFAKGVSKIVPIAGALISGSVTYFSFKPSAIRLKKHLKSLPMANVCFYKEPVEEVIIESNLFSQVDKT